MTKAELISAIAKRTGHEKKQVSEVIEAMMVTIKDTVATGEGVYLRGFGSFTVKHCAAKTGRNISKNTTIQIPARDIPNFKPAKAFMVQVDPKNETRQ